MPVIFSFSKPILEMKPPDQEFNHQILYYFGSDKFYILCLLFSYRITFLSCFGIDIEDVLHERLSSVMLRNVHPRFDPQFMKGSHMITVLL